MLLYKAPETIDIEKLKKLREQELEKAAAAANAAAEAEAITKVRFSRLANIFDHNNIEMFSFLSRRKL